jgi:hypothetical protein
MINSKTKQRIAKLERFRSQADPAFSAQIQQAALEALDMRALEQLVLFMNRGGLASNATGDEERALLKYLEFYQAEAVRVSGRTWSALVRAGLV